MAKKTTIVVTEELIKLNPDALMDAVLGSEVKLEGLALPEDKKEPAPDPKAGEKKPEPKAEDKKEPKMVQISEDKLNEIMETLKKLEHVADKGRLMNYENNQGPKKKPMRAKLALHGNGIVIGWRTVKDELIKHPVSGAVVGETQEYELLVLDKDDNITKATIVGYPAFSNVRYNERIEVEIIGKKEDFDGKIQYDLKIPDGRIIKLDPRFLN